MRKSTIQRVLNLEFTSKIRGLRVIARSPEPVEGTTKQSLAWNIAKYNEIASLRSQWHWGIERQQIEC